MMRERSDRRRDETDSYFFARSLLKYTLSGSKSSSLSLLLRLVESLCYYYNHGGSSLVLQHDGFRPPTALVGVHARNSGFRRRGAVVDKDIGGSSSERCAAISRTGTTREVLRPQAHLVIGGAVHGMGP